MVTNLENKQIAVIGLGYVGLPLLVEFSKFFDVTGYDIDERRIQELKSGIDSTKEVTNKALKAINQEQFTQNLDNITDANIYIGGAVLFIINLILFIASSSKSS